MFVVTKDGKKLPVDDSSIDYDNYYGSFTQNVGLYTDETTLKEVYILQLQKRKEVNSKLYANKCDLEFVAELIYDHYPTREEILWAMSAYGLSRWDIATVDKAYELDME